MAELPVSTQFEATPPADSQNSPPPDRSSNAVRASAGSTAVSSSPNTSCSVSPAESGESETIYLSTIDAAGNIVSLIQSVYQAFGSGVLVDGMDLAMVDPAWLRRQIGVVLQDVFLFHGTVRENILEVRPSIVTTVPRLLERIHNGLMKQARAMPPLPWSTRPARPAIRRGSSTATAPSSSTRWPSPWSTRSASFRAT